MTLPYPSMDFDALEALPAADLDKMVANIEALAAGTGLNDDAVTAAKVVGIDKSNLTTDSNPYKFRASRSSNQTVTTNTLTKIQFNAETFDTNNNFDSTTNNRYTAPAAGFYHIDGRAQNNGNGDFGIFLYKNGSVYAAGTRTLLATGFSGGTFSDVIQLAASDYIELWVISANTTIVGGASGETTFSGFLISRT